jgi:hypothetical protein
MRLLRDRLLRQPIYFPPQAIPTRANATAAANASAQGMLPALHNLRLRSPPPPYPTAWPNNRTPSPFEGTASPLPVQNSNAAATTLQILGIIVHLLLVLSSAEAVLQIQTAHTGARFCTSARRRRTPSRMQLSPALRTISLHPVSHRALAHGSCTEYCVNRRKRFLGNNRRQQL